MHENNENLPIELQKNSSLRYNLIFAGKVFLSAALLYLCLYIIDLEQLYFALRLLDPKHLVLLVLLFWGSIMIGAFRSLIFFRGMGISLTYFLYAKLYFIGYFFNNFIPSGVGGDVMRGWIAGKRSGKLTESYSAILAERLSGLLATISIALISLIFVKSPLWIYISIGGFFIFLSIVIIVLLTPGLTKIVRKILRPFPFGLADKVGDFSAQVSSYRTQPAIMIGGFLMSSFYQLSIIFTVWVASLNVNAGISFPQMCVIAPVVWTISMIPATPNAMGIRELAFAGLFPIYGGDEETGLIVSLSFFFVSIMSGLLGGLVFGIENMLGKKRGPDGISEK